MNGGGNRLVPCAISAILRKRVRTAQVIAAPVSTLTVAFGGTVTFEREDGRVQTYRIVGEDEADPKSGSISFASPVARLLMNKAVGEEVNLGRPDDRNRVDLLNAADRKPLPPDQWPEFEEIREGHHEGEGDRQHGRGQPQLQVIGRAAADEAD